MDPPCQQKSLTAMEAQREIMGRKGVGTRRVQMTRGSDETLATTLLQGQSIFGSGSALLRNTEGIEPEYSKDTHHQPLSSSWVRERAHWECSCWDARCLALGVVRDLRHTRCGEIALTKPA